MKTSSTPPVANLFMPSIFDCLVFVCFAGYVIFMPQIVGYDVWLHIRIGDLILSGIFPDQDILSFTAAGHPWITHEWGSGVIFSVLFNRFGPAGLITLRAIIAALTIGFMYKMLIKKDIHPCLALGLTLIAGLLFHKGWGLRPHIFSLLFLIITIYIYNEHSRHERHRLLAWLPLIFMFWINLHGGFVVGFLFLGLCLIAETLQPVMNRADKSAAAHPALLALWIALAFIACFANPHTYRGVLYPLLYSSDSALPLNSIAEWYPASWENGRGFIYYNFFVIGIFALSATRIGPGQLLMVLVFGLYAFRYHRITPFYAAVTIPLVATPCQHVALQAWSTFRNAAPKLHQKGAPLFDYIKRRSHQLTGMGDESRPCLILIVLLAVSIMLLLSGRLNEIALIGINKYKYPMKNTALLKTLAPAGNLFNQYRWGGFIAWAIPGKKVFIDGRIDVYGNQITEEYDTVLELKEGWRNIIQKYDITHILMQPDTTLARHITALDKSWFLADDDGVSRLFLKKPSE